MAWCIYSGWSCHGVVQAATRPREPGQEVTARPWKQLAAKADIRTRARDKAAELTGA